MQVNKLKRVKIQDKYNPIKVWEVTKLSGGFYLKQFVGDRQTGSGRFTKKWIMSMLDIKELNFG